MKERARDFFRGLQTQVTSRLDELNQATYREDTWTRPGGGGGITRVYDGSGLYLEKGGVNFSEVYGRFPAEFAKTLPVGEGLDFYATGISLVLHPRNPFAPTVHANYRYLQRGQAADAAGWFGGGADLTPCYLFEEDAVHFHRVYCEALAPFSGGPAPLIGGPAPSAGVYEKYKKQCDEYFYLPHRGETRGIGGIFFDYETGAFDHVFSMVQACGNAFLDSYIPIAERRMHAPHTDAHTQWQQIRRGRYVEFNLVYDRGTTFGLRTDGRVESILMSLPARAQWVYDHHPVAGSMEAKLVEVLKKPRAWVTPAVEK